MQLPRKISCNYYFGIIILMLPKKGENMEKHEKGSKKHLTSTERFKILKYLSLGFNPPKIARTLGFNKTTIYREIIINSTVENKRPATYVDPGMRSCKNTAICKSKGIRNCPKTCMKYLARTCALIEKPYQVCNFCTRRNDCYYEHLIYHPELAHDISKERFKNGKTNIKLDKNELVKFDLYVSKLVINGQSPEVIKSYSTSDEFPVCSRTLRNYIDKGLLTAKNIDLRRKLSLKPSSHYLYPRTYSHNPLKKIDHLFDDYLHYMSNHPDTITFQCDTVCGRRFDKKSLLTIHADVLHFQMYILLSHKTATMVNKAFKDLIQKLGTEMFSKVFQVLLSDNGTEFDNLTDLEKDQDGVILCRVFYTRSYRSSDKAECERNHELFRYIRKKGKTLDTLDEMDVEAINTNINSYPRKSLKWKTPIELMKEKFGKEIIELLGIKEAKRKDVNLTASLISKK